MTNVLLSAEGDRDLIKGEILRYIEEAREAALSELNRLSEE